MRVKPRRITRRNLQIDDPHRTGLKDLAMVRFLVYGHDRRLPFSRIVGRLPRRSLPDDDAAGRQREEGHDNGNSKRHAAHRSI
jgi:hypothetical protein